MVVGIRGEVGTGTCWYQGGGEHMVGWAVGWWWASGWWALGCLLGWVGIRMVIGTSTCRH